MRLKLSEPKLLSDAIDIVSEIVKEARIKLLEEGMSIISVDPANIALVIFKFPKEHFSVYEAGSSVWGVNLEDLKKILKRATKSSHMVFEQEDNILKITILDKIKRTFTLSLIDVSSEDKDIPNLEFSSRAELDSADFSRSIEDANVVADSCEFNIDEGSFTIYGSGSLNSAKSEFSGEEADISGKARSRYSLEYLMKFTKASKISQKVIIRFSDDYPLRLDFPGEKMGLGFILAPRVENY